MPQNSILLTFDVEDWFQVENFKSYINFSTWNSYELRVEKNTHTILELLESFAFKPKATFFVLGWIAKKLPNLVQEIHDRGHEVASHGFNHHLCEKLKSSELREDLASSKKYIEDITGNKIIGYRAPSFAINNETLKVIESAGYTYDSSYNSFSGHGRYGHINLSDATKKGIAYQFEKEFYEIPISNLGLLKKTIPLGGGGYFRLYPTWLFKSAMKSVLKKEDDFIFYAHPWEFDPDQPRVEQAAKGFKFRHYINLHKTENKLKSLINNFKNCQFITCKQYLENLNKI